MRALRERNASPYAIRPPLPSAALPPAFSPATSPPTVQPSAQGESAAPPREATESAEQGLSTYALRLEVSALADLHDALREMQREVADVAGERGMTVV